MEIDAPHRSLHQGEMLNWYRIERILGRGGFGVIYLATDTNLDHLVAIKEYRVLSPPGWDDTDSGDRERRENARQGVRRFITEARNLVRFKHPNIVRVMSVFELNDTAYMVMEFEEGQVLRDYLKDPLNTGEEAIKRLIVPITQGLAEVHKHGFVHRDIKPANILVRTDGTPVLLDFGSARSAGITGPDTLTALVSAGYAPLEQYSMGSERQQGPWTDIYALGAVLYYAVTGVEPVDSAKRASALLNGGKDPLLAATMLGREHYTKAFLSAIDWALQLRIADRPQSLSDWMVALLKDPASNQITRRVNTQNRVTERLTGTRSERSDPLHGLSMRDQPMPHEVQVARARRRFMRRLQRHAKWWGLAIFVAIASVSAFLMSDRDKPPPASTRTPDTGPAELSATSAMPGTQPETDDEAVSSAAAVSEQENAAAQRLMEEQAIAAAREQEAELARESAAAKARETAAENERIATLEAERLERLQRQRKQLADALARASSQLDLRQLDAAEASLDEAAALDRNDATLKTLRSRWRAALIDARTPVSDRDFDQVIERFDKLRRALENNDVDTMESLTTPSSQNVLFRQLMSRFTRLDISISQIRVRNADKSISATLRIESMVRDNGDRATPSPAYRERVISSQRTEGEWSPIQW